MDPTKSQGIVVEVGTATVRMDPVGFAIYADQFLLASSAIPADGKYSPVPYYLLCRALELILKALLLAKGRSLTALKDTFGHNLDALWNAALTEGLSELIKPLPPTAEADLAKANAYYKGKAFEYFDFSRWANKYEGLPPLDRLRELTTLVVSKLKPYCISLA